MLSSQRRVSIVRGVCLDNGQPGYRYGNESPLHRVRGRKKTRSRHSISGPEWFESPLLVTSNLKWSARNQTNNRWEQEKQWNHECSTSDHLQQCWGVTSWFALSVEANNAIWVPLPESGQILHSETVVISFFRGWVLENPLNKLCHEEPCIFHDVGCLPPALICLVLVDVCELPQHLSLCRQRLQKVEARHLVLQVRIQGENLWACQRAYLSVVSAIDFGYHLIW